MRCLAIECERLSIRYLTEISGKVGKLRKTVIFERKIKLKLRNVRADCNNNNFKKLYLQRELYNNLSWMRFVIAIYFVGPEISHVYPS